MWWLQVKCFLVASHKIWNTYMRSNIMTTVLHIHTVCCACMYVKKSICLVFVHHVCGFKAPRVHMCLCVSVGVCFCVVLDVCMSTRLVLVHLVYGYGCHTNMCVSTTQLRSRRNNIHNHIIHIIHIWQRCLYVCYCCVCVACIFKWLEMPIV